MQITQQARDIVQDAANAAGFKHLAERAAMTDRDDIMMCVLNAVQTALNTSAPAPMTEDEILQRAGRAYEAVKGVQFTGVKAIIETAVAQALRDLDKPLVDPVVLACREILAKRSEEKGYSGDAQRYRSGNDDHFQTMECAVAAYRAGMQHNG